MQIDIQRGWAFKPDPSGEADWSSPSLDDSAWDVLDAGAFWQKQGYDGYAGVAWYRRWVEVPAAWAGRDAYLVLGGVNDEYAVFVEGKRQGEAGSLEPGKSAILDATATPVTLSAGKRNLVAIRVRSGHNFGGIAKGPVALTTLAEIPRSPVELALDYARAHPDGVWPGWMRGQGRSWTTVGLPKGGTQSLAGPDGSWEASASSPAITAWLVDRPSGKLLPPRDVQWSLTDGRLPIVHASWRAEDVAVATQLWQAPGGSVQWRIRIANEAAARDLSLVVAVRPYQVQDAIAPLYQVSLNGKAVLANGKPALIAAEAPSRTVASTGELGDVSVVQPDFQAAEDGAGLASIALVYDLRLDAGGSRVLAFAAPLDSGAAVEAKGSPGDAAARWRELLRPGSIQVPDRRVADAFYASLAYILMSNDGGALHPGPLLHDAFWYRDSAYMLSALERAGLLPQARELLTALTRFQAADGEFPANLSTHRQVGHRRGAPEWDSQGQGIHALVEYYRFSRDLEWLRGQWPAIDRAAAWLERLIGPDGLLPPGESAEDLGPADQRHFWDDFWAVIGLRDASLAAAGVGQQDRASQLSTEADALLEATLAAGQPGLGRDGVFPNGPGSPLTPAAARGTSPAVWPGRLLERDFARKQFQGYFERFITPYGGAFRHENNNFWPFGGLEIAHASLLSGLPDQASYILDWHLDHPTARGVWAWGDEVSQDGSRLIGGDMPHGWTAAEYVSLVRDMLFFEDGATLQLAPGVRAEWLASDGMAVAVDRLPAYFGTVSYELRRAGSRLTLDLQPSSPPPGGYDLHLPLAAASVELDGAPPRPVSGLPIHLPPATRRAVIGLA
jgi:hypothetical protein